MTDFSMLKALRGEYDEVASDKTCGTHGAYHGRVFLERNGQPNGNSIGEISACPACNAETHRAEEENERGADLRVRLLRAAVPPKFRQCSFSNYLPSPGTVEEVRAVREYAKALPSHLQTGQSLIMTGGTGTGKTHLSVALIKSAIVHGLTARYTSFDDMLGAIRSTWSRQGGGESEADVKAQFTTPEFLVIDEVGASAGSDAEAQLLNSIIDQRYRNLRPMLLVTNIRRRDAEGAWRSRHEPPDGRRRPGARVRRTGLPHLMPIYVQGSDRNARQDLARMLQGMNDGLGTSSAAAREWGSHHPYKASLNSSARSRNGPADVLDFSILLHAHLGSPAHRGKAQPHLQVPRAAVRP